MKIKNWTILSNSFYKGKVKYLKVRCNCGKEKEMLYNRVFHKTKYNKCISCSTKENNSKKINQGYKSIGDLGGTYFNYLQKKARNKKIKFLLTKEFLWNLLVKQNFKCKLSGIPIKLSKKLIGSSIDFKSITASLDRIDNNKGYIENNVQWVHKWINTMKNTLSTNDFIYLCKSVSNYNDNSEPSFENRDLNFSRKVQRLTDETSLVNNSDTSAEHPIVK